MSPLTPSHVQSEGEQRKRRLQILGLDNASPEATFDRVARIAASLTQAPLAMVNFVTDERQMFRGMYVPPSQPEDGDGNSRGVVFDLSHMAREVPADYGFCPHVVAKGAQLALDDVFDYPRFKGNPLVNDMGVRAYLGTPLRDHTGMILGTVCVADMEPRHWGPERMESMQQLTETLLSEFQLRDSLLNQQKEMFAVFDGAPFPIMLTEGPDHLLRYANAEQGAAFGRVPQLSPGRRVLPGLEAAGVFNAMDQAFSTGRAITLPDARVTPYGARSPRSFSFTCTPVRLSPTAPISGVLTVAMSTTAHSHTGTESRRLAARFTQQLEQIGAEVITDRPDHRDGDAGSPR